MAAHQSWLVPPGLVPSGLVPSGLVPPRLVLSWLLRSSWPLLAAATCAACGRAAPIASCDDDLRGVYVVDGDPARAAGAASTERWMVLDSGPTLEAYPLFPDGAVTGGLVAAPRMIDLARAPAGDGTNAGRSGAGPPGAGPPGDAHPGTTGPGARAALAGTLHQRFMQRAAQCNAQVPVHVTRCAGDTLELVLADPSPPIAFSPCTWPGPAPSRVVRWRRE